MAADLNLISRCGSDRFAVDLVDAVTGSQQRLECAEVVRRVAGRRIVCRGVWHGQPVYAKLFIGARAQRYAARDAAGVRALEDAGIATPLLLFAGAIADAPGQALVFAEIGDSADVEQVWNGLQHDSPLRFQLAVKLVTEVARHHQAGLLQHDLYLKNFLLQGEQLYTLDGDGIRPLRRLLAKRQALRNLALLLSKFDIGELALWLPELIRAYAQQRGWSDVPAVTRMHRLVMMERCRMATAYADRKVLRQCGEVEVERSREHFLAIARPYLTQTLRSALNSPDDLLLQGQRLKSGNTCTVGVAEVDGRKLVIKRYNIKNFWHGLGRALRSTRAALSWSNAYRLRMVGIATAAPVALLEKRCGMIRRQAYFVAEYVDAPDVRDFFADRQRDSRQRAEAASNVASLFYKLYLLKIAHGDFKASNMKILHGHPLLIDLDSMHMYRCRRLFERQHARDLRRFLKNWQQDVEAMRLLHDAFQANYKNTRLLRAAGMKLD